MLLNFKIGSAMESKKRKRQEFEDTIEDLHVVKPKRRET